MLRPINNSLLLRIIFNRRQLGKHRRIRALRVQRYLLRERMLHDDGHALPRRIERQHVEDLELQQTVLGMFHDHKGRRALQQTAVVGVGRVDQGQLIGALRLEDGLQFERGRRCTGLVELRLLLVG